MREVDENLRRDRARDFARRHGKWLIAAVLLFIAACGAWIYWQYRQEQQSEREVEQLAEVYRQIATSNEAAAARNLDQLANSDNAAVRASVLFTRAALALQQNDAKLATAKFQQIAGDEDLAQPYRDLALIRQTALEFDRLKPDEVIARMDPLATAGSPWFGSAGELKAVALIKQGKKQEAGRLFAAIAKDRTVPDTLRARSVQIASTLGVDASAALDAPGQ